MKRALAAVILIAFLSPLMLVGTLLAISEQTDPALASGVVGEDARALLHNPNVVLTAHAADRVSNHFYGRAVDITAVDATPVNSSSLSVRRLVLDVAGLSGPLRPDELGHPFGSIGFPGGFTDADHLRHIHIGYR